MPRCATPSETNLMVPASSRTPTKVSMPQMSRTVDQLILLMAPFWAAGETRARTMAMVMETKPTSTLNPSEMTASAMRPAMVTSCGTPARARLPSDGPPAGEEPDDSLPAEPEGVLSQLCWALGIGWDATMLQWRGGPHPQDGVWAAHWYGHVEASTGFEPAEPGEPPPLNPELQTIADACMDDYLHLSRFALRSAQ